jgi:uncharacterized membrane protein YkoI
VCGAVSTPTKGDRVNRRVTATVVVLALGALTGVGIANAADGASGAGQSRLDDGKDLLPQAKISEQQAIQAAQSAASGALNEVDLEHHGGRLVWNVDVGAKDVKVDAATGHVVAASSDD